MSTPKCWLYGDGIMKNKLAADFLFLTGLFGLGGDFWDKLRALFVYDARAQFEPQTLEAS
jgi:hypothetical protein